MIQQIVIALLYAARSEIGHRGGRAKSAAKAMAARKNGRKGGRPKTISPSNPDVGRDGNPAPDSVSEDGKREVTGAAE